MLVKEFVLVGSIICLMACGRDAIDGSPGVAGPTGLPGTPAQGCSVEQIPEGALIKCGSTYAVVEHGRKGSDCKRVKKHEK